MVKQLEDLVKETIHAAKPLSTVLQEAVDISAKEWEMSAVFAGEGTAVVSGEEAGAAAVALAGWEVVAVVVLIVIISVILARVEDGLAKGVGNVRFVGGALQAAVHLAFLPVHLIDSAIEPLLQLGLKTAWRDVEKVFRFFVPRVLPHITTIKQTVVKADLAPLWSAIGQIKGTEASLQQQVYSLQHATRGSPVSITVQDVPLAQQIHQLQNEFASQNKNILQLHTSLSQLLSRQTTLENELTQLEKSMTGTHTVQIGWQDIVSQIHSLESTITKEVNSIAIEQQHISQLVGELSPLTLLLEPGMPGLRTLRKLEDDPCQCPKFAGIPGDVGTALAFLEFIENG